LGELARSNPAGSKPIIGVAGGIGSGKSTVAAILRELGAAVIDSDRLTHEALGDPAVIATLRQWWGDAVCGAGGGIDREAVARVVFHDSAERERLEGLIYPRIEERRQELTGAYQADPAVKAIVLDAPKLFEVGLEQVCDAVIFVEADRAARVARVQASRGWTEEELQRRENMQMALDIKKANADYVVVNHSGIEALRSQVERVFAAVLASLA
jgi:dephospho-CoA kinase